MTLFSTTRSPTEGSSARLGVLLGRSATPCLVRALAHGGDRYFLPRSRDRKRKRSTYFDEDKSATSDAHEEPHRDTGAAADVVSIDLATAAVLQDLPLETICPALPRSDSKDSEVSGGEASRRPACAFFGHGQDDSRVVVLTCRDTTLDNGSLHGQGAKGTTVNTSKGFKTVDGARYGAIVNHFRPHIACGLALAPSGHAGSKRLRKTVDGTSQLFQQFLNARVVGASSGIRKSGVEGSTAGTNDSGRGTARETVTRTSIAATNDDGVETAIFAPIVGGADMRERLRSLDGMLKIRDCAPEGYLLAGFSQGETRSQRKKLLGALVQRLPTSAPRMYECAVNPVDVLHAVQAGMDMIACSFPDDLTRACCAATFRVDMEARRSADPDDGEEESGGAGLTAGKMCLRDQIYRRDLRPMVAGCTCYACENHTRAYIHHLVTVHEIMGKALLDAHNWHHAQRFAREIRERIATETLDAYVATF